MKPTRIAKRISLLVLSSVLVLGTAAAQEPVPRPSWAKVFNFEGLYLSCERMTPTKDGGFLIAGAFDGRGKGGMDGITVANPNPKGQWCAALLRYDRDGRLLWVRAPIAAPAQSNFYSAVEGPDGRIYAVGRIFGGQPFSFAAGHAIKGSTPESAWSALIVAYDASGRFLWARSAASGKEYTEYRSVAVDSRGSAYAAGAIGRRELHDFGEGVQAQGSAINTNLVVVKYSSDGRPLWIRSVESGWGDSSYSDIAVDSNDCIYAAGNFVMSGDMKISGGSSGPSKLIGYGNVGNALVVKYDSEGSIQWTFMPSITPENADVKSGLPDTSVSRVLASDSGGIIVAGHAKGVRRCFFPGELAVNPVFSNDVSPFVIRIGSDGSGLWANSSQEAERQTVLRGIVSFDGGFVFGGYTYGTGILSFGEPARVEVKSADLVKRGAYDSIGSSGYLVGLGSGGEPAWALTPASESGDVRINELCVLADGRFLVLGSAGSGRVSFGNDVSLTCPSGRKGFSFFFAFPPRP